MGIGRIAAGKLLAGAMSVLVLGGMLGGCANQRAYDDANRTNRALQGQLASMQSELESANRSLALKDRELAALRGVPGQNQALISEYERQLREKDDVIRRMQAGLNALDTISLDPATDQALAALASRYRDILTYDSSRGMLRFNSDLTFDSGSDVVRPGAVQTLSQFAQILQGSGAAYDVEIVGHTDSQPISARTAERHPTNVHLSAHRAISVRTELTKLGIPASRMMVGGWGEHRPLVANTSTGNTPQNRRVEIFLRPSTAGLTASVPTDDGIRVMTPDRTAPPPRVIDGTK
ncbi:MAG: OmpA family protein [Phycisphaeraceae bacterium]|nr:OmpA family protein [Phycisphaeraceae bacterium]MCW5755208.1 OmpA family protein [Phycisphaeraceae bacterium]